MTEKICDLLMVSMPSVFLQVSALTFVFGTMNVSFTENSKQGLVLQISNTTVPESLHRKLLQVR